MQSRLIKSLCYALIVALTVNLAPITLLTPANAQIVPTYSVGVLDFVNESGVKGDILSRLATDAVVVEMSKTNRYDVGITRSQIKTEIGKLELRPPLVRVDIVRLGQGLNADAMLEGFIKSVKLSGIGSARTATVTMAVQMIDVASGATINGAIQTGSSASRVGFEADDDSLITEAINKTAFLAVQQMVDYVIPEATVQMNVGLDQVRLNKGGRDGLKPGMRMIVLRQKEIIGYLEIQTVDPTDAIARVSRSLRGVQPEDRARAIYEMAALGTKAAPSEPLPSGPPSNSTMKRGGMSGIAKIILTAAIVYGVASAFKGGRGSEDSPSIGTSQTSNTIVTWNPTKYGHGKNVMEYQILRDDFSDTAVPFRVITDPSIIDSGRIDVRNLYGTSAATTFTYTSLDSNPATTFTSRTATIPAEAFGTTHTYQVRVVYKITTTSTNADDGTVVTAVSAYRYTGVSNSIRATAIDPVHVSDLISPAYDSSSTAPEIQIGDLRDGTINFQWNRKDGANEYYVKVTPVVPGATGTFDTRSIGKIYETGPTVELSPAMRVALADFLNRSNLTTDTVLNWKVYARNTQDTSSAFTEGEFGRFRVGETPPVQP